MATRSGDGSVAGRINQFDPDQEQWPRYVERLEQFFEAKDITGDGKAAKRRATFLSVIGPAPYQLLRSLLSPMKPTEKTFEELVAVLSGHYSLPPSEIMQRFRFNSRSRKSGESVAAYVAELRRLAEFCNYGTTLDKMLRDRSSGTSATSVQKKLIQEKYLTLQQAVTLAQGSETAAKNVKETNAPSLELDSTKSSKVTVKSEPVYRVAGKKPRTREGEVTCHRCGTPGHLATVCKFRESVCHKFKKKGNLGRVCGSKSTPQPPFRGTKPKRPNSHTVQQVDESDIDSDDSIQPILTVNQRQGGLPPIKVLVEVDGCSIPMEVDTGASVSIMSEIMYHKLWPRRSLGTSLIRLQTYSKEPIAVVGSTEVQVAYEGQIAKLPLVVVKGEGPTLLGRNWLGKMRLNWSKIHYASGPGLHDLLSKYGVIFQEGLGTFQDYEVSIEVNPDTQPRFCKARTLPYAMR